MNNDQMSTQPTIETLLERMNSWGEQFTSQFTELHLAVTELRTGQNELRKTVDELRMGQDQLRTTVDELSKGQEELRKGQDELRKTVDELSKGQEELRDDLHANLHLIAVKIQALNDSFLTGQVNMRNLVAYIERLELGSLAPK